jgi:hypothetical protein
MSPIRLHCLTSPLHAFLSCGSTSCRCLQTFGGSVGTYKASRLCVVLHECGSNNPHVIVITFYSVTDYVIYFLKLIMEKI